MSSQAVINALAVGVLTWVASATQSPAAEAMRGPWVHSEASASSNSPAPSSSPRLHVQSGTALQVRLNRSLSTKRNLPGDRFTATLAEPIVVDGRTAFPKGAQVTGRVEESAASGRLKGRAHIMLALQSIQLNGHSVPLSTSARTRSGQRHRKRNALWIGGGSGAGALIGGLAGGPVGLAIGAGSGAAAGLAGAMVTGKKQVSIPAETLISFRLTSPVEVAESPEYVPQQRN